KYPLLVWGITCFIFVLLLFFLKFPLIILSYGIALSFLCLAAWLTSQWFSLKKKLKLITYLDDTTLVANRNRIHEKDLLMRAYFNHYEKRLIEQANERQRYQQHLEEQKDYFTLWLHQIKTPISSISLILQQESVKDSQQKINHELIYLNDYTHMGLNYLKLADTGHDLDITSVAVDHLIKSILTT